MEARALLRRDILLACLLAVVLGAAWSWADWTSLRVLRLPDTDDVVRLQQIRDWLAGQAFADVSQHRLGGGLAMHWSRLADLLPCALIALLTPMLGTHMAEVTAVVAWPVALFAGALLLVGRIARALATDAATAMAVAAIAFPATTLFMPGRIDHHGLQMVLLLGAVLATIRAPGAGTGTATGLLAAASLTIGLETAPLFAALGAMAVAEWIAGRSGTADRLWGLGIAALVGLAAAKGIFATTAWEYPACDGFTGMAWRAAIVLAAMPLVLAALDRRVVAWRSRLVAAMLVTGVAGGAAVAISPACLSPYGAIDPAMARLWLAQVGEAQPLFAATPGTALGYAGLMIVGLAGMIGECNRARQGGTDLGWDFRRAWGWAVLLACQLAALAVTMTALRGAYAGALLAAPALAAAIKAARSRGTVRLVTAWAASAGMLYPIAAQALVPAPVEAATARGDCTSPAMLADLNALPVGTVIAPIDAGAYLLAGTRHRLIAAPYHRNDAGNRAVYAFYLGDRSAAGDVARRWRADYALSCAAMPSAARAAPLPGWRVIRSLPDGAIIYGAPVGR